MWIPWTRTARSRVGPPTLTGSPVPGLWHMTQYPTSSRLLPWTASCWWHLSQAPVVTVA